MQFNELMTDFGKRLDLDEFQPDENGICEIDTDDFTVTFQYVPETEMVLTTGLLCELGPDPSATFFRTLLEANFMFNSTHGATVSVDPTNDCVMLARYDRLNQIDGDIFFKCVELFMQAMLEWKDWFKAYSSAEDTAETSSPEEILRV